HVVYAPQVGGAATYHADRAGNIHHAVVPAREEPSSMTRPSVAPPLFVRLLLLAAPACLLVAGPASGGDRNGLQYDPDMNTFWYEDPYAGSFDGAFPGMFPGAIPEDPTGGAMFLDTSGGDASEIASSMGFDVTWLYGGYCVADPGAETSAFAWLFLCSAINGADPYADAAPDFFIEDPEGSQSNG